MTEPYDEGIIEAHEKRLDTSPYVCEVTVRLAMLLAGRSSMLDIGAGTGVFSLGAPKKIAVTAVEASSVKCHLLDERARKAGRDIRIIPTKWEQTEVPDRAYDVVLCANAICQMEPLEESLAKMMRASRGNVLIVMNARKERDVFGRMRRALKRESIPSGQVPLSHTLDDVKRALARLGAVYKEELVSWPEETMFRGEKAALRYLESKLGTHIWGETMEDVLMSFFTPKGDMLMLKDDMTMAFLTVRV